MELVALSACTKATGLVPSQRQLNLVKVAANVHTKGPQRVTGDGGQGLGEVWGLFE